MFSSPRSLLSSSSLYSCLIATVAFSLTGLMGINDALANPQGLTVTSGKATVTTSGNVETITQGTDKAILNWGSFNIGDGETTNFVQPSAGSVALNRIGGNSPSQILGMLNANGQIILVNPNGVFFGKNSTTNAAGLIASTADINANNFAKGYNIFSNAGKNGSASIVNQGTITAKNGGLVALVAPGVRNDGIITANVSSKTGIGGAVVLGAGNSFDIHFNGNTLYGFNVNKPATQHATDQNGNPMTAAITNTGTVKGETVLMTVRAASNLLDNSINNTGLIQATSVRKEGGTIVLDVGNGDVANAGTVITSGTHPGQGHITVAGNNVALTGSGTLTAGDMLAINNQGVFSSDKPGTLNGNTVTLNQNADGSIQNAIDSIADNAGGSTLYLDKGSFFEHVDINKNNFALQGSGQNKTVILALPGGGAAVVDAVDIRNANNVSVSNITIQDGGSAPEGVGIATSNNVTLKNTTVTGGFRIGVDTDFNQGIPSSNGITISNNNFTGDTIRSVNLIANNSSVTGNTISGGVYGISLLNGIGNSATNNKIDGVGHGIVVGSTARNITSNGTTVSGNTIMNGGTGIELYNSSDKTTIRNNTIVNDTYGSGIVLDPEGGITNVKILGNTITGGTEGIDIGNAMTVQVANNTITSNTYGPGAVYTGVGVNQSTAVEVGYNTISDMGGTGILVNQSSGNIDNNAITDGYSTGTGIHASNNNGRYGNEVVAISNNTIKGGYMGINLENNDNTQVSGNAIRSANGIALTTGEGNNIKGNIIQSNGGCCNTAIAVTQEGGGSISDNTIQFGHSLGIDISKSADVNIERNTINDTSTGIQLTDSNNNFISQNTIAHSDGGIALRGGNNNQVENNVISSNSIGLNLANTTGASIYSNTFDSNLKGVNLETGNTSINIAGNALSNNQTGVNIVASNNNIDVQINTFKNNTRNDIAIDPAGNNTNISTSGNIYLPPAR